VALQKTLTIIKPDVVKRNLIGEIIQRFERAGFRIIRMNMEHLAAGRARGFYEVHKGKPFFNDLIAFMTSGPCVPMVLEKDNAIADLRTMIGVTDSKQADCGTVRQNYGTDVQENAVHASDSEENARIEIGYFFPDVEI
jgi:nucleoside-diphosphate kinase